MFDFWSGPNEPSKLNYKCDLKLNQTLDNGAFTQSLEVITSSGSAGDCKVNCDL